MRTTQQERMERHRERLKVVHNMLISPYEPKIVTRRCLKCEEEFRTPENKWLCQGCKNTNEWKEQY